MARPQVSRFCQCWHRGHLADLPLCQSTQPSRPSNPPCLLIVCFDRYPSVGSRFSVGTYIILGRYGALSSSSTSCRYGKCSWIPVFVVFVIATAVGGKHFVDVPTTPATASQLFSFGGTIAGFTLSWAVFSSDYTTYFHPRVSRFVAPHVALHYSHSGLELNQLAYFLVFVHRPQYSYSTRCPGWPGCHADCQ
jgi:hypothetical protein